MYNQAIQGSRISGMAGTELQETPGLISITADNISGRAKRLNDLAYRVQRLADRIFGGQPEAVAGAQPCPNRAADADRMHQSLESLDGAIERLESQFTRVEQL